MTQALDENGFIPVNNGQLYYAQSGQGEQSIVWVHGLPLNSDAWYPQLRHFNPLCRNIVFDLRGYGRSSKLPENCSSVTDLYLDDFLAVLHHCQLKKPVLVGFASAGHAVMRFAALFPQAISQLVVINGSPCFMSQPDWIGGFDKASLARVIEQIDNAPTMSDVWNLLSESAMKEACGTPMDKLKQWYQSMAEQAGKDTIKAFFSNIAYDDDRALLKKIIAPTLIISSRLDKEVPSDTALYLRQAIKGSQLFEINDIDHFAYATQSTLVNQVIEQFITPRCEIIIPTPTANIK